MNVKEDDYLLGIWFVGWGTGDWMATAKRTKDMGFEIEYRFRYYEGPDPWDGKDSKNWYKAATPETDEEKVIAAMDGVWGIIANRPDKEITDRILIRGGSEKFIKAIQGKSWFHIKTESIQ